MSRPMETENEAALWETIAQLTEQLATAQRELAATQDRLAGWWTAAVPYATPSALYDALKAARTEERVRFYCGAICKKQCETCKLIESQEQP